LKALPIVLRFIWFILRLILAVTAVISLSVVGFMMARDSVNVYIIASEGMEQRAAAILGQKNSAELSKYFAAAYLPQDQGLTQNIYTGFIIRDFEYKYKLESMLVNPWGQTAQLTVVESIPEIEGERPSASEGIPDEAPPAWQRRRYQVNMQKMDGAWLITELIVLENLEPEPTPTPLPSPSESPAPVATAAPQS